LEVGDVPVVSSRGIFLSYRREEARADAHGLYRLLRERLPDVRVFMDLVSIEAGLDFVEVIREALDSSAVQKGLQAEGTHRGTRLRATQDLPGTEHDVPPRPHRVRKRMAARLHRPQSTEAAPAPRRGMTAKGPVPGGQHPLDNPKSRPRTVSHSRIPDLAPPREPLCDRLRYAPRSYAKNARSCRTGLVP
jgi:hypothetical protein